jgi:hypothetical protein
MIFSHRSGPFDKSTSFGRGALLMLVVLGAMACNEAMKRELRVDSESNIPIDRGDAGHGPQALMTPTNADRLSLVDFGADPTGKTDSTAAIRQWSSACHRQGKRCRAPAGTYLVASSVLFDVDPAQGHGVWIEGDGCARTIFQYTGSAAPGFRLGTDALVQGRGDNFYSVIQGIGFSGSVDGPLVQLGRDDFADSINGLQMDQVCINNARKTPSAVGVRVNSVVTSRLWMSVSMDYSGTACELRSPNMTTFQGSCSGGDIGILFTSSGTMLGNVFLNMDLEVNSRDVVLAGSKTVRNTFIGGQFDYQIRNGPCAIDAYDGESTTFENPNIAGATALCGVNGVVLRGQFAIATPPLPGSDVDLENRAAQAVEVTVWNGRVEYICVNGSCVTALASNTVILNPEDRIRIRYSSAPSWRWRTIR